MYLFDIHMQIDILFNKYWFTFIFTPILLLMMMMIMMMFLLSLYYY